MRIILIGLGGAVATTVALGISRLSDARSVRDLFFFVAIVAFVLTLALMVALGVVAWVERSRRSRQLDLRTDVGWRGRWGAGGAGERCGSCNRRMAGVGGLWICPVCDRVPV